MGENEKRFVALIVEFEERLTSVREHIKANFSIGSEFDKEKGILNLFPITDSAKKNIFYSIYSPFKLQVFASIILTLTIFPIILREPFKLTNLLVSVYPIR